MEHIGKKVNILAHLLHQNIDSLINEFGISPSSGFLIHYIHSNNDSVYQKEIEQNFHIRRSSVTSLVQGLEKSGYLVRVTDEKDTRLKRIQLTEEGILLDEKITQCMDLFEENLHAVLGNESELFNKDLDLLIQALCKKGE